jgi:hypothetical protein
MKSTLRALSRSSRPLRTVVVSGQYSRCLSGGGNAAAATIAGLTGGMPNPFENIHQKIAGRQRFYKTVDVRPVDASDTNTKVCMWWNIVAEYIWLQ